MPVDTNINISDYAAKTKFSFHNADIPIVNQKGIIPIGLDVGYSSTKVYSIFGRHIFPSFLIRLSDDFAITEKDTDILYKDEKGQIWAVGKTAHERILGETKIQTRKLYGRQRIDSPEFLVLLRVGIFFGLIKKDLGRTFLLETKGNIKIRTGLPVDYFETDKEILENKIVGHHRYEVKVGKRNWVKVNLDIAEDDVSVIMQPFGTLWSLAASIQGDLVDNDLLNKNVLIYDGGQHTTDTYFNQKGRGGINTTWTDISMVSIISKVREAVLKATGNQGDFREYSFDDIVSSSNEYGSGVIKYMKSDANKKDVQFYDMTNDIIRCTEEVVEYAINELNIVYNYLLDFNTLICTGGVGKLFYPYFKRQYHYIDVMLAEKTDSNNEAENFDTVFANVVGYFKSLVFEIKYSDLLNDELNNGQIQEPPGTETNVSIEE